MKWPVALVIVSMTASVTATVDGFSGGHSHSSLEVHGAASDSIEVTVYKSPTCGCCKRWVDYMRRHGFRVVSKDTSDVGAVKSKLGVPATVHSCHTAVVGGYVVEGHVPVDVIQRLLSERPDIAGIAVAGMPAGSPGMETGGEADHYDVMSFGLDGTVEVYARK